MPTTTQRSSGPSMVVWIGVAVAIVVAAVAAVAAVAVFLVVGGDDDSAPADDEWVSFVDPATGLSVELPGEPTSTEEQIPFEGEGVDIYLHMVDDGDAVWSFTVYVLPSDELDLGRTIDAVIDGIDATVVDSSDVTVSGFPGIDSEATFTENGRDGVVFSRIVMLEGEQTAVILQSLGLEAERDMIEASFDRLAASFSP